MENMLTHVDGMAFKPAYIDFQQYNMLVDRAENVAAYINSIEIESGNVKEVKQTLADARKLTDGLDTVRKTLKKEIMGNYDDVERKIKFIISIVDGADAELRAKVKKLEEAEREEKKEDIRRIWSAREFIYTFPQIIPDGFDRWITPQHLNKTTSMSHVESDMVDWMEQREKDVEALSQMDDEYTVAYIGSLDLSEAIRTVNANKAVLESVKAFREDEPAEDVALFAIKGKKNIKLAEMVLTENEIEFEKRGN